MKFNKQTNEKQRLLELIHRSHQNKNFELEALVYYQGLQKLIQYDDFVACLKRIKNQHEFKMYPPSEVLNITFRMDSKYKYIRVMIYGKETIKYFCAHGRIKDLGNNVKYYHKESVSDEDGKPSRLNMDDYYIRFNLKEEKPLNETNEVIRDLLDHWMETPKFFRYKKIFTFETTDGLFRNDLSIVKESRNEDKEVEARINLTREWDEDSEEFTYSNLEDEVFALRFARTYKPIYESVDEVHNLEIEFIEYPVSAYKNIIPLYSLDAANVFETKCKFVPNNIEMFFEVCTTFGIDKSRIDIPTHSGLRYAKIDDTYLTGAEEAEKSSGATTIGTYDECLSRMNSNRQKLEDMVSMHLAKRSQKVLDKGTVGELLKELLALKGRVSGLDVKQKDYNSQRSLVTKMNELIETYKQLA